VFEPVTAAEEDDLQDRSKKIKGRKNTMDTNGIYFFRELLEVTG